jgi:hypothetical protein
MKAIFAKERKATVKDTKTKKEMIAQYKDREIIGGVYAIKNLHNKKLLV